MTPSLELNNQTCTQDPTIGIKDCYKELLKILELCEQTDISNNKTGKDETERYENSSYHLI
jgi:hypothetical protein